MTTADPNCKGCGGTGIRDIWVIDGWSATDCLCESGWTFDETRGTWKEPQPRSQDEERRRRRGAPSALQSDVGKDAEEEGPRQSGITPCEAAYFGDAPDMIEDIKRLRAILAYIDNHVMFEAHGMGNTFADSIECYLQHGGLCPTVEEARNGALLCGIHR